MSRYYDTGIVLKLYTEEPESDAVRRFVVSKKQAVVFTSLHRTECVSALKLKFFRKECAESESAAAILDMEEDIASGVLKTVFVDWAAVWEECRILADAHAGTTGCRTLDALHVACAKQLGAREFVTSDARQAKLATKAGLRVVAIV